MSGSVHQINVSPKRNNRTYFEEKIPDVEARVIVLTKFKEKALYDGNVIQAESVDPCLDANTKLLSQLYIEYAFNFIDKPTFLPYLIGAFRLNPGLQIPEKHEIKDVTYVMRDEQGNKEFGAFHETKTFKREPHVVKTLNKKIQEFSNYFSQINKY